MNASQIDPPATESVTAQPEERSALLAWARRIGAAVSAGMLAGLVVGGIGGRIAMFILRVTSSSRVNGIESDDGFRIGQISGQTFFLLLATTALGAIGGLIYLFGRQWVPARWRVAVSGTSFGVVLAAGVIKPDGVDFTLLSPLWLAVVLFVLISVVFGVVVSVLVERLLAREARLRSSAGGRTCHSPRCSSAVRSRGWRSWSPGWPGRSATRSRRSGGRGGPRSSCGSRWAGIAALVVVNAVALAKDVSTIL